MSSPKLYLAVTSHGFGHAVRVAAVAAEIQKLAPDLSLIFATTAPRWLLQSYLSKDFEYRPVVFDVGVIQQDSLTMDKAATLQQMQSIKSRQAEIIAEEVKFIQSQNVSLILADIPPLVTKIAQEAKIPCWMMSNFGWDFIYRDWGEDFAEIVAWISDCYGQCDRLFRLPLNEPMSAFPVVTEVGLTGGTPKFDFDELRAKFGLDAAKEKTVLLSFGGLGLQAIPYQNLEKFSDWQFITFDSQAPELPNLAKISGHSYRPVDFMPLCGRIVSKPGYSTFSEALRLDVPIVSLTRTGFAEAPVLLKALQDYFPHQIISNQDFFETEWQFLNQELTPPQTNITLDKDGAEAIAKEVVNFFATLA